MLGLEKTKRIGDVQTHWVEIHKREGSTSVYRGFEISDRDKGN